MEATKEDKELFRTLSDAISPVGNECWEKLEPLLYRKKLEKNCHFSNAGQAKREFGIVCSGIFRIYYLCDKGKEWTKHFLQENDFIASSLSPEKPAVTSIQALTESTLVCVSFYELTKLANEHPSLQAFIQSLSVLYLEQKQSREIHLLTKTPSLNYRSFNQHFPGLENQIAHYHIASYLGITPTQLSRLRKKLHSHLHR